VGLAPGELTNLNGYRPSNEGNDTANVAGSTYRLAATWVDNGQTEVVGKD
jgi:hypothetical protein